MIKDKEGHKTEVLKMIINKTKENYVSFIPLTLSIKTVVMKSHENCTIKFLLLQHITNFLLFCYPWELIFIALTHSDLLLLKFYFNKLKKLHNIV